jgi:hypothetical protein
MPLQKSQPETEKSSRSQNNKLVVEINVLKNDLLILNGKLNLMLNKIKGNEGRLCG